MSQFAPIPVSLVLLILSVSSPMRAWGAPEQQPHAQDKRVEDQLDRLLSPLAGQVIAFDLKQIHANLRSFFESDPILGAYIEQLQVGPTDGLRVPPNAFTWVDGDHRSIAITPSLVRLLRSISRLRSFETYMTNGSQISREYQKEWLRARGRDPVGAPKVNFTFRPADLVHHDFILQLIEGSADDNFMECLAWIILHELAHHKLLHVLSKAPSLEESRKREIEADVWAFQKFREMGFRGQALVRILETLGLLQDYEIVTGAEPREDGSTHPSWKTRVARLRQELDRAVQAAGSFQLIRSFVRLKNPKTGGSRTKEIPLILPVDLATFPISIAMGAMDGNTVVFSIKKEPDQLVLRGQIAGEPIRLTLKSAGPGHWGLEVQGYPVASVGRLDGGGVGYETSWATYGGLESNGLSVRKAMANSPQKMQEQFLRRISITPEESAELKRIQNKHNGALNELFVAFTQGELSREDFSARVTTASNQSMTRINTLLGEERSKEYSAAVFANPFVQMGIVLSQKPLAAKKAPPRLPATPVLAAPPKPRSKPGSIELEDYRLMLQSRGYVDRGENPGGRGHPTLLEESASGSDAILFDRSTGLNWQRGGSKNSMTYDEAEAYVATLNTDGFLGQKDWRLPTLEESVTLAKPEYFDNGLFIESRFDAAQFMIWTCDRTTLNLRWILDFTRPSGSLRDSTEKAYVRVVRSGS